MMIRTKHTIILLSLSLLLYPCFAQSLDDTLHIKEVSVYRSESASDQMLHETVIDTLTMQHSIHSDLSELLTNHSTVYIKSTGKGQLSTASFRGTDPSHTKVFWNGIRLNSPMLGQVDLSMVPVCFADQVSLLHGSSSLTETSGALGGTISLQSLPEWDKKTSLRVNQEIGSFHSYYTTSELDIRSGNLLTSSKLFFNTARNNFPFTNTGILPAEDAILKNAGYRKTGFNQDLYYRINHRNQFSFNLWHQKADRNIPQPMSYEGSERSEKQNNNQFFSSAGWKHYRENSNLEFRTGFSLSGLNYMFKFPESDYVSVDSRSRETGLHNHFRLEHDINVKTHLVTKVSHTHNRVEIDEKIKSEGYSAQRSELSAMLMLNRQVSDRISAWVLFREDLVNTSLLPVMPSMGGMYKILKNKDVYIKSTLSRNYNIPSLNDLYWIPGGNPALRPEMSYTGDLSAIVKHTHNDIEVKWEIIGFASLIDDWILWSPTQFHYWTAENIASVFSRGMETMFTTAISGNDFQFKMNANYSLTLTTNRHAKSRNDQSKGKQLIYIPRHFMNANSYFNYKGYFMNYSFLLVGKRYTQSSNEETHFDAILNTYSIHHVLIGKELSVSRFNTSIQAGIYNLFNTSYQVILARPMPGRNFTINLEISF